MNRKIWMTMTALLFGLSLPLFAATYTVTNTNDTGPGSLRDAMQQANASVMIADTINFSISGGGGIQTILPLTPLPVLTDPAGVVIDGLTEPGASGGTIISSFTLLIEIDGIACITPCHGIEIQCTNNTIRGLVVNNFLWNGICVKGVSFSDAANNLITQNIVGLDPSGTISKPNGTGGGAPPAWAGIMICNSPQGAPAYAYQNTVEYCVSSSNNSEGISVIGPIQPGDVYGNHIHDNFVGTDITGMNGLGNTGEGICLCEGTHDNTVELNHVSGNSLDGIGLQGFNNVGYPAPPIQTYSNVIQNNVIGLKLDLVTPLPNGCHGIAVGEYGSSQWGCTDKNRIGPSNLIAHNGWDGISVWEDGVNSTNADQNKITQNMIHSNTGLGIDLQNDGITPNDPGDTDIRPNEEVNFPVITSVSSVMGMTTISGFISIDTTYTLAVVEVFKARVDLTGCGEGEVYLGSVTPDAAGFWSITTTGLLIGDSVTATTTDMNDNTSEFCANMTVPGTTLGANPQTISQGTGGVVNFTLSAGAAYANRKYVLVGSVSGTSPGTPLPGGLVTLPLNRDWFTNAIIPRLNTTPFTNFKGQLDTSGSGTAQFNSMGPLPSGLFPVGTIMDFAYVLQNPYDFASNPISVQVVP